MSTEDDPKQGSEALAPTAAPDVAAAASSAPAAAASSAPAAAADTATDTATAAETAAVAAADTATAAETAAVAAADTAAAAAAAADTAAAAAAVADTAAAAAAVADTAAAASAKPKAAEVKPTSGAKAANTTRAQPAPAQPAPADDPNRVPEPPPWWKTLRADPPAHMRTVLGIGLVVLLLLVWWFVTRGAVTERIISPSKLPSPGEVFGSITQLLDRKLDDSTFATLERVFKGLALAALVGISVGVLAASNRGVGSALSPLVIFLRSVPMGAMIPLTLLLFGDGEKQKWMFIFLAIVPFVFSDTVKAISIVPERYVETAQTLGATRFQIVRKVLVPLALPDIITSLRFQLGLALGYIMLVEEINTEYGLGTLIIGGQKRGLTEQTFLLLFVIALIAFTLDLLLRTIQRGVFAWRRDL